MLMFTCLRIAVQSLGLIFGQSGSGKNNSLAGLTSFYSCKSALLNIHVIYRAVAGIMKPTFGSIHIKKIGDDGNSSQSPKPLVPERVGIVFQ
ncbi:unnamed protein product [Trifolium pratense]|uniref:Uncharacterized protein n=1 Tax=Trifolium pratense TaxID=57577 RepID=A0ACB0K472_TRIPR|nr:unnamed protein product [Trifolium pratense]